MADPKTALFENVATRLATLMEKEDANWTKPWSVMGPPRNPLSAAVYRGFNNFQLTLTGWERGWSDPRWATFKQIKEAGGNVKKGEKSTMILRFGQAKKEEAGEDKTIRFLRVYWVFNIAEQAEGIELPPLGKSYGTTGNEELDRWIATRGIDFRTGGDRACYDPLVDHINMPPIERFEEAHAYYSTFFHELIHATGHPSRLARFTGGEAFGSADYAREEFVAEVGAAMLCQYHGLSMAPRPDHARYLNAWAKRLREAPKKLMGAAAKASDAATWLIEADQQQKEIAA
jgi:antirestriction protein ArdC